MASNKSAEVSPPDREEAGDQPRLAVLTGQQEKALEAPPGSEPEVSVEEVDVLSELSSASGGGGEEPKAKGEGQDRQDGVQCALLRAQPNVPAGYVNVAPQPPPNPMRRKKEYKWKEGGRPGAASEMLCPSMPSTVS